MNNFCNPADKLITICFNPQKFVSLKTKKEIPLLVLEKQCKEKVTREIKSSSDKKKKAHRVNVATVKERARVGFFTQTKLILQRIHVQATRLPLTLLVLIINGIMQGCL